MLIHSCQVLGVYGILISKLGQTELLVVGMRSGFISRSASAVLHVSVCLAAAICIILVKIQT